MQHLLPWATVLVFCGLACNSATTGSRTAPIQRTVTNFGQTVSGDLGKQLRSGAR